MGHFSVLLCGLTGNYWATKVASCTQWVKSQSCQMSDMFWRPDEVLIHGFICQSNCAYSEKAECVKYTNVEIKWLQTWVLVLNNHCTIKCWVTSYTLLYYWQVQSAREDERMCVMGRLRSWFARAFIQEQFTRADKYIQVEIDQIMRCPKYLFCKWALHYNKLCEIQ